MRDLDILLIALVVGIIFLTFATFLKKEKVCDVYNSTIEYGSKLTLFGIRLSSDTEKIKMNETFYWDNHTCIRLSVKGVEPPYEVPNWNMKEPSYMVDSKGKFHPVDTYENNKTGNISLVWRGDPNVTSYFAIPNVDPNVTKVFLFGIG